MPHSFQSAHFLTLSMRSNFAAVFFKTGESVRDELNECMSGRLQKKKKKKMLGLKLLFLTSHDVNQATILDFYCSLSKLKIT